MIMKLYKIFACALFAVALTACSEDDDKVQWNSAPGVTVELEQADVSFKEGKGLVYVPVLINGEANGNIMFTVECEGTGTNPAKEDVQYIMTTKTLVVSPEDKSASLELNITDFDAEMTDSFTFDIKIVAVKACEKGANTVTSVTVVDNDKYVYDRMAGRWRVRYLDGGGSETSAFVTLRAADEGTAAFNEYYMMSGLADGYTIRVDFNFDEATKTGSFEIPFGQYVGTVDYTGMLPDLGFGTNVYDTYLLGYYGGNIYDSGSIVATFSEDLKSATFDVDSSVAYLPLVGSAWVYIIDVNTFLSFER